MRVFAIAAVVALLTGPAYAQMQTPNINLIPELVSKTPEEKAADAEREKAYKELLKKIPDAKVSSDPWGNVRSAETPKTIGSGEAADQNRQHRKLIRLPPGVIELMPPIVLRRASPIVGNSISPKAGRQGTRIGSRMRYIEAVVGCLDCVELRHGVPPARSG